MIRIYTTPSCSGCRKAKKWLSENEITFKEKNILSHRLSKPEILDILKYTTDGFDSILSRRSDDYSKVADKLDDMKFSDMVNFIIENPKILKRPIMVSNEGNISVGYNNDDIRIMMPSDKRTRVLTNNDFCDNCGNC